MFAYNPTEDRSAEILTNASNQAAEIQLAGYQSLANSIAKMGESAAKAYEQASENQMTASYLDSMAGELNATKRPDGIQYVTNEELEAYSKSPLNRKKGIIAAKQAQRDFDMRKWMIDTQYNTYPQRIALANQQAANQAAARQPAANQIPMSAGSPPPTSNATTETTAPTFGAGIKTRRVL